MSSCYYSQKRRPIVPTPFWYLVGCCCDFRPYVLQKGALSVNWAEFIRLIHICHNGTIILFIVQCLDATYSTVTYHKLWKESCCLTITFTNSGELLPSFYVLWKPLIVWVPRRCCFLDTWLRSHRDQGLVLASQRMWASWIHTHENINPVKFSLTASSETQGAILINRLVGLYFGEEWTEWYFLMPVNFSVSFLMRVIHY